MVARSPKGFDTRSAGELTPAFSRRAANSERWLLDHADDALPIVLINGAVPGRPASIVIPLDAHVPMRIEAVRRLCDMMTGRNPGRTPDDLSAGQRDRLKLILRTLDGKFAGCSWRTIAEVLFDPDDVPAGRTWSGNHLRSRTRRLYQRGLDLMNGEYLDLLLYPRRFRC
jgi:hypothetical protein